MTTIATDFYNYLNANTTDITFVLTTAQPDAKPPFVEITETARFYTRTTVATSLSYSTEFDIECWHTNTVNAQALGQTLIDLLTDFTGSMNVTTTVDRTRITNVFTGSDNAAELFYCSFTVQFTHK